MSKRLHTRDIMESTMVQKMHSAKKPMWAKNILQGEVVSMAEVEKRSGVVVVINKVADERVIQMEIPEREAFCICNMETESGKYLQCEECMEFFYKNCMLCKNQKVSKLVGFACPWC